VQYTGFSTNPTIVPSSNILFNLPTLPVSANPYKVCFKAVINLGAVGGTTTLWSIISGTNLSPVYVCYNQFIVCSYAAIGIDKKVKGSLNANFANSAQGAANTNVDYQITLRNTGTMALNYLEVVDRIPAIGNLTILGSPNSTAVSNQFNMQMLTAPANVNYTANYTNTQNICTGWAGTGVPCNTGLWGTAVLNGGVKFTFVPSYVLLAGATYTFTFQTKIPAGTAVNLTDCNTAGFIAKQQLAGTLLNPTESNPVCVNVVNPCDTNVTANFTINTSCLNGVLTVNATSLQTGTINHEWRLMQTSVCGNTTNAFTLNGGNPVAPVQFTTNASFTINNFSNCYYIKHRIYLAGCYDYEVRIPIVLPQANNVFNFEDVNGLVKSTFCVGEDIYLDGTASTGENQYSIGAWRRPIGSTGAFTFYASLGSFPGQAGIVNLSQLFGNLGYYFDTQYEYSIKLTISNIPNCIGPIVRELSFKVICCEGFINPNFQLSVTPAANSYSITSVLFNPYTYSNATHEWYVLSSPNAVGGPYTPVYSATTTSLTYSNCQYNLYYTVIHKVTTECGEVCVSRVQYQTQRAGIIATTEDCCLAFQFWPDGAGSPPQEFTASFELGATPLGGGQYTIDIYPSNSYSNNPNVTHEWYVLSSPNPSGGPYTAVAQSSVYNYSFSPADDGLYYFVIHKVKSPCGDVCYGQSICRNCRAQECELCGPIDCKLLDEVWPKCYPPFNLKNDCRRELLTWDIVPAAGGYQVELDFNDPACCRSEYLPTAFQYNVSTNLMDLNSVRLPKYDCIRWKVRAKCENGYSEWSQWLCYYCYKGDPIDPTPLSAKNGNNAANEVKALSITPNVVPNPNNGDMNIEMEIKGQLVISIQVFNTQGVLVKTIKESKYPDGKFYSRLNMGSNTPKGLYLLVFKTNVGTFNKKVIIN
jgi:hypothetical protein